MAGTSDMRRALYRRYVSSFKGPAWSEDALRLFWRWCEHKYLPLLADVDRGEAVLEIGCGPGYLLDFLRQQGFTRVQGIDIAEEQAAVARRRGHAVAVADAPAFLETVEGRYRVVVAVDVLEHFARDELLPLVERIHRALRPGGLLIVQTANGQGLFPHQVIYGDLTHLTVLTPQSLGQLLRFCGFEELAFYETGPTPQGLRGRLDVALWGVVKAAANLVRAVEAGKRQQIWTETMICRARKAGQSTAASVPAAGG